MRIREGIFENFGSYKKLSFDFSNLGLALAFGKTGSGKSTIPDMVAWTLFGQTAKDGSVDDVKSWTNQGEDTTGTLIVETKDGSIIIVRNRSKSANRNDLYWTESADDSSKIRGKDITDTQKLLEKRLGISSELFFMGVYFHEFSSSGLFFTASSKSRRATFERIANLELAIRLGSMASESRKLTKRLLGDSQNRWSNVDGKRTSIQSGYEDCIRRSVDYELSRNSKIKEYEEKSKAFEKTKKEKISAAQLRIERWNSDHTTKIDNKVKEQELLAAKIEDPNIVVSKIENAKKLGSCVTCKQPFKEYQDKIDKLKVYLNDNERLMDKFETGEQLLQDLKAQENPHMEVLELAKQEENTYSLRIIEENKKSNPFNAQAEKLKRDLDIVIRDYDTLGTEIATLETKISNLTALYDISFELRGELLKQAVEDVQDATNRYLEKFFDSEIRVGFKLEGSDDLVVNVEKSGHACVYKQLSRGQRALLRLCFVVSIMKAAANSSGVHFDNLFFDEVLDGLDGDLKVKAFSLFQELSLEHSSILLIDHASEFQNLFTRRFHVTMESDNSFIEEENE